MVGKITDDVIMSASRLAAILNCSPYSTPNEELKKSIDSLEGVIKANTNPCSTPRSPASHRRRNRILPKNHRRRPPGPRKLQTPHQNQPRLAFIALR